MFALIEIGDGAQQSLGLRRMCLAIAHAYEDIVDIDRVGAVVGSFGTINGDAGAFGNCLEIDTDSMQGVC